MNWNYNSNHYSEENVSLINPGNHRVEVVSARETWSKNGNEGIEIIYNVNGYSKKLKHYIWYDRKCVERTNQRLGEFFNSFDIQQDEWNNCLHWVGKRGAVNVVHDEYKGHMIAKVAFCIKREFQGNLAAWGNENSGSQAPAAPVANHPFGGFNPPIRDIKDINF